ncbi:MAG: hypothetical protein AAF692_01320 [Pseudomonadota bacterium]
MEPKVSAESTAPVPATEEPTAKAAVAAPRKESAFQDYEGFDDSEADLIDDTAGFDPSPVSDDFGSSDDSFFQAADDNFTNEAAVEQDFETSQRPAASAAPQSKLRFKTTQTSQRRPPAKKGMSIEQMKKRLALPPRVKATDN